MSQFAKKLVLVLATSLLISQVSIKANIIIDPTFKITKILILVVEILTSKAPLLKRVLCIYYPVRFKRN